MINKWFRGPPKKKGIYLRNNPPSSHVVRQDVIEVDDELCVVIDSALMRLDNWKGAAGMWWFGPIPKPPFWKNLKTLKRKK